MKISFKRYSVLCCILFITLLSGCSKEVGFTPGIVTQWVKGKITLKQNDLKLKSFIIARKYHKTFIETTKGNLYRASIKIIKPDLNGFYQVYMDSEVDFLELQFFAKGYKVDYYKFNRTIGIGSYSYNPTLIKDKNWKNNFYFMLKPVLSDYIVDIRYELNENDQQFLVDWIKDIDNELLKKN